jgi:hypothetical protein
MQVLLADDHAQRDPRDRRRAEPGGETADAEAPERSPGWRALI